MKALKNNRILRALLCEPVDRTPVWFMRQAGRYLPEFRALRAKEPNFMRFCQTPELACEVTLQPLQRFDLDAAIIFSDILTIPDALGLHVEILPNTGPVIHNPIRSSSDVKRLPHPDVREALSYVFTAITLVKKALNGRVPLIGFAGSPWTVACYCVEGQTSKDFQRIRGLCYENPDLLHALLSHLSVITVDYLNAQIEAGADVVMLFDTWGGLLPPKAYQSFSLHYLTEIAQKIHRERNGVKIPVILFTKGGGQYLEAIADSGCDAVGLDWTIDIGSARARIGDRVALQGNLDPAVLLSNPDAVRSAVHEILLAYGGGSGHVFNLGHGIDPQTPVENVAAMIEAVHGFVHS